MAVDAGIGKVMANPFVRDGKALVSKVTATGDLKGDVLKAVSVIGGFGKAIEKVMRFC